MLGDKVPMTRSASFILIISFLLLLTAFPLTAKTALHFSSAQEGSLNGGEIIINVLESTEELSVVTDDEQYALYLKSLKKLRPTYLCECIKKIPVEGNSDLPSKLDDLMLDIGGYTKIPYYSQYNDVHTYLFQEATLLTKETEGSTVEITAKFEMSPFDPFKINMIRVKYDGTSFYRCRNTQNINYLTFFRAASKNNMDISLYVSSDGEFYYIYSIGAIKTFKFPFFEKRIRMAIVNRLNDFASYFLLAVSD